MDSNQHFEALLHLKVNKKNQLYFFVFFISFSPLDNSTIVFPIPIDLVSSLIPTLGKGVNNDGGDCDALIAIPTYY